ncbi:peptide chain release factor N(5)-glutamine methyltransferase [uncultured Clostridium sp.]|uniref:peptide chain release factor N(5)-glutamine methyltransferase n=1 Tax=uncultured Clostridium sp. TaxID=59620 RepID=UPI0028E42F22|nr:peptide chain release factor N(5)-glutamine methyltransferase [uncultured Clostridium sp.]
MNDSEFTVGELLIKGFNILKEENIPSYKLDCQLLLGKAINKDKLFIMINRDYKVSKSETDEYFRLVNIRKNKMPVKYILGECEFMSLNFNIKKGVLIPRPDTEILVEEAINDIIGNEYKNICDLCCGSGIIGISIAKYTDNTHIDCYDIEEIPLEVTRDNIYLNNMQDRVSVYKSDLLMYAIKEDKKYDMIVSNPPYIKDIVIEDLMDDVKKFEPYEALSGGEDGLDFYRRIIEESKVVLKKNGIIAFEIGYDQGEDVMKLLKENNFSNIECKKDLAGLDRVIKGRKL